MDITANRTQRLKALGLDYLAIVAYLAVLAVVMFAVYQLAFGAVPRFSAWQSQAITFVTSVAPIAAYAIWRESRPPYGTFGKHRIGLMMRYSGSPLRGAVIRNAIKFLPWQLAHTAVIEGMYTGFSGWLVWLPYTISIVLVLVLTGMVLFRRDHRHLGDMLAGAKVIIAVSR